MDQNCDLAGRFAGAIRKGSIQTWVEGVDACAKAPTARQSSTATQVSLTNFMVRNLLCSIWRCTTDDPTRKRKLHKQLIAAEYTPVWGATAGKGQCKRASRAPDQRGKVAPVHFWQRRFYDFKVWSDHERTKSCAPQSDRQRIDRRTGAVGLEQVPRLRLGRSWTSTDQ